MTGPSDDIPVLRFSTDDLPERDRLAVLREVHGRLTARTEIEPTRGVPLHFRTIARLLPGLVISSFSASSASVRRTREMLADGNDDILLTVSPTGLVSHLGRELMANPGDAVLFSLADSMSTKTVPVSHGLNVALQRRVLARLVPDVEDRLLRPISSQTEALRLLINYVRLAEDQSLATRELCQLMVSHVYDLVALAFGAMRDASEIAKARGLRAARLHAIKTEIVNGLNRHDLSLPGLAAHHGVTPRYVQMLFESEGTTFSQFLLGQRLAQAHRMLRDPRFANGTISAIAYAAGFGDLSHFNRTFRRRYGESPSDVRSSARESDRTVRR
jgi:AraC-like DNA-binding protein